jgi:tRNA-modifying protein YgfZ
MPISEQLLKEYEAALQDRVWFDLSDRTKIEITGADRAAFLHNFCTNDIKGLPLGRGCEAFLCNARGKILAYIRVYNLPDALWIDATPGLSAKIVEHLASYVIAEDVTVTDRTEARRQRLIAGPTAELGMGIQNMKLQTMDARLLKPLPLEVRRTDELAIPCFHLFFPPEERVFTLWERATPTCYEILRIEAGTPEYGQDIDESNYPQEVGRDAKTISFTKGCYLGQEPIVMIRDRGQVSRLLVGLKLGGNEVAAHGAKIWRGDKEVGHITSSVVSPRFGPIALGYVRRGSSDPGTAVEVEVEEGQRVAAEVTTLPFA